MPMIIRGTPGQTVRVPTTPGTRVIAAPGVKMRFPSGQPVSVRTGPGMRNTILVYKPR